MLTQDVRCYEEYGARLGSLPLTIGLMRFNIGDSFVVSGNEPDMPSASPPFRACHAAGEEWRQKFILLTRGICTYSPASSARAMQLYPDFVTNDRIQGELQVVSRHGVLVTRSYETKHGARLASWQAGKLMPGHEAWAAGVVGAAFVASGTRRTWTKSPVHDISLHASSLPIQQRRKPGDEWKALPRLGY